MRKYGLILVLLAGCDDADMHTSPDAGVSAAEVALYCRVSALESCMPQCTDTVRMDACISTVESWCLADNTYDGTNGGIAP